MAHLFPPKITARGTGLNASPYSFLFPGYPRTPQVISAKSKMAMKLTTEAVKMRFPGVSNMSTDELLQLIRQESSKLLLLVGGLTKCFKITEEKVLTSICKRFNSGLETLRFSTFLIFLQNIIETLITLGYKPETSASL